MADSAQHQRPCSTVKSTDWISNLPDFLLCYILSFLPTKLAVHTSILSKRWMLLWTCVPVVDFDDEIFRSNSFHQQREEPEKRFGKFVNMVLLTRGLRPIQKFRLKCNFLSSCDFIVETWINHAMGCKLEHLELDLSTSVPWNPSVVTCRTLVVLELKRLSISLDKITSPVLLPLIETLHVEYVQFGCSIDVFKLLSGYPGLQHLVMFRTHKFTFYNPLINVPKTINLTNLVEAQVDIDNVRYQPIKWPLTYIKFQNLTRLHITFGSDSPWDMLWDMLQNSPKLEFLNIQEDQIYFPCGVVWTPQHAPECVSLHLKEVCFTRFGSVKYGLEFLRYILENARVLEKIKICCHRLLGEEAKLRINSKLSAFPRSSSTCKLIIS